MLDQSTAFATAAPRRSVRQLRAYARRLARSLANRHGRALAEACRLADGEDGAALAYALLDMIADGSVPLHFLPLAEAASLLALRPADEPGGVRAKLAALIGAIEAMTDADLLAPNADGDQAPAMPAVTVGAAA